MHLYSAKSLTGEESVELPIVCKIRQRQTVIRTADIAVSLDHSLILGH